MDLFNCIIFGILSSNKSEALERTSVAIFSFAYFGLMRGGEALSLKWENVRQSKDGLEICLVRSKTDTTGCGTLIRLPCICAGRCGTVKFCPVHAFEKLKEVRPVRSVGSDPLFGSFNCVAFQEVIKSGMKRMGFNSAEYSTHSLRRGVAQRLDEAGLYEADLKRAGRWVSDAYREYLGHNWKHALDLRRIFAMASV